MKSICPACLVFRLQSGWLEVFSTSRQNSANDDAENSTDITTRPHDYNAGKRIGVLCFGNYMSSFVQA